MRLRTLAALLVTAVLALPGGAAAQLRQPAMGAAAVGGDLGVLVPEEALHTGFSPQAYGEFYLMPRLSLRVLGGWSRNRFVDTQDRYLDQIRGSVNVVYNWEFELWHPFVTAGLGAHRLRVYQDGAVNGEWSTRAGFNVGTGVEYFVRPKVTFKAEGTFYWLGQDVLPCRSASRSTSDVTRTASIQVPRGPRAPSHRTARGAGRRRA